jgi:hypothetical protein
MARPAQKGDNLIAISERLSRKYGIFDESQLYSLHGLL